jgi:hypothetical protein
MLPPEHLRLVRVSASAPDGDPLGRPDLEAEAAVVLPGFQDPQLAAPVDVIEHDGGVGTRRSASAGSAG